MIAQSGLNCIHRSLTPFSIDMEKNVVKTEQLERIQKDEGFIAALDQSGGSTPKALQLYGISEDQYKNDEQMFNLIHCLLYTSPSPRD